MEHSDDQDEASDKEHAMTEDRPDDTAAHPQDRTEPFARPTPPSSDPRWSMSAADHGHHPQAGGTPPAHQLPGQQQAQHPGRPQQAGQHPFATPAAPYGPQGGQPYGQQTGQVGTAPPRRGNRAAVPLAALLAAVLASGGTYALTQGNDSGQPAAAGNTTVVEGDPADYADAGNVNWSATSSKVTPSVVAITTGSGSGSGGTGSGVVLDDKGNIVTNNHVVAGSDRLEVTLADKRTYKAKVVGTDPSTDLAVIRLENPPSGLKPTSFGDDDKLAVGQPVMAVGNPLGLAGTVTTGIVSALNRPVSTQQQKPEEPGLPGEPGATPESGTEVVTNAIQTSAAINPGNSGGALVDGSGDLIGINSSIATLSGSSGGSQGGNIGIGFAIPVTVVKNITEQLIADGKADHARLGVTATNGTAEVDGASIGGAKVVSVADGSGAAKAGITKDDVILKIDGESVDSSTSLVGQVRERTVGQRAALSIVRDGKRQDVTVTLGSAPSE